MNTVKTIGFNRGLAMTSNCNGVPTRQSNGPLDCICSMPKSKASVKHVLYVFIAENKQNHRKKID